MTGSQNEDDEDGDADEDSDPAEPALGSLDGQDDQTRWAAGGRRDLTSLDHLKLFKLSTALTHQLD